MFFTDWAIHSAYLAAEEAQKELHLERHEEQKGLMQVMEQKILPHGFGNGLYRNNFISPRENAEYHPSDNEASTVARETTTNGEVDEYTRVARLEKFFDAASNCSGRRGNRVALTELVVHISKYHSVLEHNKDLSLVVSAVPTSETLVVAHSLVNSVYRMALACSFLSAANTTDEDITQFLPSDEVSDHAALKALSQSIIDYAKKKRIRANPYGSLSSEAEMLLTAGVVTKEDVLEWSEMTAPLFSVVMPTLLHLVMFPDTPYPPSRTSFELPRILEESCFFDHGSSPLLFSFGCLSSSLRGTVSAFQLWNQ